ncbi:hypothetical protein [Neorhizobium petrolearium]|uniref:Phage tail tube protein, GTA-gp10 n=1 Tax=Neorhizobium petrolearium TaxID=515361 RepID=A0ABY8M292_9HYPH|nr:hypothetical protein [Neorhizobium petrolearium]MCC2608390.1 hypothetical protein [Neorhizobium petrolearium]WGI68668.1 hypothetical protein QEO92_00780 [Neorhizobium petrolearium]
MTNSVRGIVSQEIDGERLEFCLSANEWCELEDEFGKKTDEILKEFGTMAENEQLDMRLLRSIFRAAVSYSKQNITLQEAGVLMRSLGLVESAALIGTVIVASMPEVKASPAGKPKRAAAR